ncbi:type II secretion system protein [Tepidimicrobium xylanilyticum]|uniref:Type IV pilus assembly protein PilA n=1 Tax=Tepidimicrobium xylanilyticum TaxID=1123352 RepID=A0A1H3CND7_9FIRM|nr:prepilin-type N-terminal cleavage/methylation domain-containing protein [Tepidimicrobium xylanilyticum]GMG97693.1 hypothetical protein EN5CB1_25190 [Tepidimicrobium xylanilyticum]SDX55625.1 type IV pilus assembly protein PilA [Tepidimicrobium xylanilyticum]
MIWRIIAKFYKNYKGFTLIEIIIVISIIGLLTTIAIPRLGVSRKKAAIAAHNANVRVLMSAATMHIADGDIIDSNGWTGTGGEKADAQPWAPYIEEWPTIPRGITDELKRSDGTKFTGNDYKVTVDEKGNIIVEPVMINKNN